MRPALHVRGHLSLDCDVTLAVCATHVVITSFCTVHSVLGQHVPCYGNVVYACMVGEQPVIRISLPVVSHTLVRLHVRQVTLLVSLCGFDAVYLVCVPRFRWLCCRFVVLSVACVRHPWQPSASNVCTAAIIDTTIATSVSTSHSHHGLLYAHDGGNAVTCVVPSITVKCSFFVMFALIVCSGTVQNCHTRESHQAPSRVSVHCGYVVWFMYSSV